jgi:hypothetical protein
LSGSQSKAPGFAGGYLPEFKELYYIADRLINELSKDQLAEVARLLALHVAHYAQRHGEIPAPNLLELLGVAELTDQQTKLLRDGMEILVGYLGTVQGMEDDDGETPVH